MNAHFVLIVLVIEGHAHQRLTEGVTIGRVEVVAIVAVGHHAAAGVITIAVWYHFAVAFFHSLPHRGVPDGTGR